MSFSDNNNVLASQDYHPALSVLAQQCPVTAVPIKKRPVIALGLSSPHFRSNDFGTSECKPSLTIPKSAASDNLIQPFVATAFDIKGISREPKVEPKEELLENTDLNKIVRCDIHLRSDRGQAGLELPPTSKEDSAIKRDPPFQPVMESVEAPSLKGSSHIGSVLDLNLPGNACDDYLSSTIERNGDNERMVTGGLSKNIRSSELTRASAGTTYARLRKCTTQSGSYDFGLGALSSSSNKQDNSEVTLDLQLKPPCKPEPKFKWADISSGAEGSDAEGISLGLSLLGNRKPALGEARILKNKDVEVPSTDLASSLHVNSGSCHGDESSKTAGPGNLVSDSFGSTTLVLACNQAHGHSMEIGVASPSPDKKVASVMEVPQYSCDSRVKNFYNKSQTSCGDKVKDFYSGFVIDLNIPILDSYCNPQAPANPSKPLESGETSAEVVRDFVAEDQYADNNESQVQDELPKSSSLLKEADGLAASNLELGCTEMNSVEDVNGADGSEYVVSHGNKPAVVHVLSGSDSNMVGLNYNGFISLEVQSVELPMEMDRKSDAADSGEEIEEFEEVVEEVSAEGSEEVEEVVEEVSCDDESDNSHCADGDENIEEFEEVSCEDVSDISNHGEAAKNAKPDSCSASSEYGHRDVGGQREESASHATDGAKSIPVTISPTTPSQKNIENPKEFVKEKKQEATISENLQPSALEVSATITKSPLKRKHDLGTKPCINKDIVKADEEEGPKLGWGRRGTKSGWSKEIAEATEQGNTTSRGTLGKRSRLSKATEEGNMNQGGGSWRKQSDLKTSEEGNKSWGSWRTNKDIAEATEKSKENGGWGTWETKNGGWGTWETKSVPKDITEWGTCGKATEKSKPSWERRNWETKSDTKDIAEGSYKANRRENTRRLCSPPRRGGRIITLKTNCHERSYYGKTKPDHDRPTPSHVGRDRRERFSESFRHDKPHRPWQRHDRYKKKFHKPENNNRDGSNQFGKRRSDYTWVRDDQTDYGDALHCNQEYADIVPSSQRQSRERDAQQADEMIDQTAEFISLGPTGGYSARDIPDFQRPPANERRVVRRDFTGSSPDHHSLSYPSHQYPRAEDSCTKRNYSPNVIQDGSTEPCSFRPSPRPFEHPSRPWLRSPETPVHDEMKNSQHYSYYPHQLVAPIHDSIAEDEREIDHYAVQCAVPGTRLMDNHPQQTREEGFRLPRYCHGHEQPADAGSFHERHTGMQNSPSRPSPNRDVRGRLGNTSNIEQIADAGFSEEVNYGVENGFGPDGYVHEPHEDFQRRPDAREYRGNVRDRIGRSPNRGRGMRGTFRGRRKVWHDPDSRDAELRRRY